MKNHMMVPLAVAALGACGQSREPAAETNASSASQRPEKTQTYSGTGTVTAVAGDQVTIDHGPVEEIGWPAMTMAFSAGSPDMVSGVSSGDRVSFEFQQDDGRYTLTSLSKER